MMFVPTKYFGRDKGFVQVYPCRDKRRVLSRQTRVCRDNFFVATKMILVAAPGSDTLPCQSREVGGGGGGGREEGGREEGGRGSH